MSKRPNILLLMSDEHRFDISGFMGNTLVRTPNLDRLAEGAVVFDNAYCPSPICVPGRQSFLAGQFPRTTGAQRWGEDLAPGYMTWPRLLSQYAYETVACGKLHLIGPDQMQGFTRRIGSESTVKPQYIPGRHPECFESFHEFRQKWDEGKEVRRAGIGKGPSQKQDEYAIRGALDFIEDYFLNPYYDRETPDRPLLLKVSLTAPHYPYLADKAYFEYYLPRVRPYENATLSEYPFLADLQAKDVSEREVRRAMAAYYGMIEKMDTHFGQVLDALEFAGQNLDDWIVIYTSDHGEMLGEHGVWEKRKFYEGSARVPFFIRMPRRFAPARVSQNVSQCDLFATLCDLCDLPTPDGLDSRSLLPLLQGEPDRWEDEAVCQFGGENLMIKRGSLKYHFYEADGAEFLFDLAADPGENRSFASDPAYAAAMDAFRARRDALHFAPAAGAPAVSKAEPGR